MEYEPPSEQVQAPWHENVRYSSATHGRLVYSNHRVQADDWGGASHRHYNPTPCDSTYISYFFLIDLCMVTSLNKNIISWLYSMWERLNFEFKRSDIYCSLFVYFETDLKLSWPKLGHCKFISIVHNICYPSFIAYSLQLKFPEVMAQ